MICTRERPQQLELCLRSLEPNLSSIHEVVVVDNAPRSDATRRLVQGREKIRYVCEPRPGLSAARNTGIAHSKGDIIVFTDDDVVVHADWARRLREAFLGERTMCVTGLVLPSELRTEAQVAFERSIGGFGTGFLRITYDGIFFERMKRSAYRCGQSAPARTWPSGAVRSIGSAASMSVWVRALQVAVKTANFGIGFSLPVTNANTSPPP